MSQTNSVVERSVETDSEALSSPPITYTYYHAGPLFTLGDLTTNVRLSAAVCTLSSKKFQPVLPQDLEQRDNSPHSIRDDDIKALLSCDLALFTYDGSELDSGTVIEYMVAKFADIPCVILRTDFRGAGDQGADGDPWNLMSSFWPRSVGVVANGMVAYKTCLAKALKSGKVDAGADAGEEMLRTIATQIIAAFDEVLKKPARLPKELRQNVYQWLALAPGFKSGSDSENIQEMQQLLQRKELKQLFDEKSR